MLPATLSLAVLRSKSQFSVLSFFLRVNKFDMCALAPPPFTTSSLFLPPINSTQPTTGERSNGGAAPRSRRALLGSALGRGWGAGTCARARRLREVR